MWISTWVFSGRIPPSLLTGGRSGFGTTIENFDTTAVFNVYSYCNLSNEWRNHDRVDEPAAWNRKEQRVFRVHGDRGSTPVTQSRTDPKAVVSPVLPLAAAGMCITFHEAGEKRHEKRETLPEYNAVSAWLRFAAHPFNQHSAGYGSTHFTNNRHIFVNVANDAGVKYDLDGAKYGGPSNTYYIKADGGGLNELHITNDMSDAYAARYRQLPTSRGYST